MYSQRAKHDLRLVVGPRFGGRMEAGGMWQNSGGFEGWGWMARSVQRQANMTAAQLSKIANSQTAARSAHDFASAYIAKYGQPSDRQACVDMAAAYVPAVYRDLFIERAIGHFANAVYGAGW